MNERELTEIILCSGIKMDKNYENVLSYSEEDIVNLCRTNAIYSGYKYKIIGVRNNVINLDCPYGIAMYANYLAFKNPKYGDKWIFGWVTDVKLLNDEVSQITFKTDVFSTWYSRFSLNQAFIEREHVDDDTVGKHTIPENLETGEYICNSHIVDSNNADLIVVMGTSITIGELVPAGAGVYNNIPSGVMYYAFSDISSSSVNSLTSVLSMLANNGKSSGVNSLFIAPQWLAGTGGMVATSSTVATYDLGLSKMTSLNGYTPTNKKLLTYPYCYFTLSNAVGYASVLRQEVWDTNNNNEMVLRVKGCLTPGCSIKAIPINYNGAGTNDDEAVSLGKFPMLNWINDQYTNWLTQNGVNIGMSVGFSAAQIAGGLAAMSTGAGAGIGATSVLNGTIGIANALGQVYQHYLIPPTVEGNVNSGDVTTASGANRFHVYKMSIRDEYARSIDAYFSRFGYKVNEVKTPNLNSRTVFNFIKVGGMDELVSGNIPATDLEEINSIFRKGVTIFHDYTKIGNYTVSNPIRNS